MVSDGFKIEVELMEPAIITFSGLIVKVCAKPGRILGIFHQLVIEMVKYLPKKGKAR